MKLKIIHEWRVRTYNFIYQGKIRNRVFAAERRIILFKHIKFKWKKIKEFDKIKSATKFVKGRVNELIQ